MKKNLLAVAVASLALTSMAQAAFQNMTVNGIEITKADQEARLQQVIQRGAKMSPELENQIRESFIADAAVITAARASNVGKNANVAQAIKIAQEQVADQILVDAWREEAFNSYNPSEADITKAYNDIKAQTPKEEYQFSVIATKTKAEAQKALASLKSKKFADVAKKVSVDPTAQDGGQLDYMFLPALDAELQGPAKALKVGQYTQTPIQVKGLWVILKLDGERKTNIPTLAQLKQRIVQGLKAQHVQEMMIEAAKNAKVSK